MWALGAALIVLTGALLVAQGARQPSRTTSPPTGAPPQASDPGPVSAPARLRLPTAGVDVAIEPVGLTRQGDLDVPRDARNAGWFARGPAPGQTGSAVIDGHRTSTGGGAAFWSLDRLRPGDRFEVRSADGRALTFQVAEMASYPAGQPPPPDLFSSGGPSRVALITCAGDWNGSTYSQRLVVEAVPATPGGG